MANEKTQQILDLVKTLTILELADLVKAMEEEFGVCRCRRTRRRGEDGVRCRADQLRRSEEAQGHQGGQGRNRPVSGRSEGPRYGRTESDQDRRFQGRGRGHQDTDRGRRRRCHHQVKSRFGSIRPVGDSPCRALVLRLQFFCLTFLLLYPIIMFAE